MIYKISQIPIITYHKICRQKEFGINVIDPIQFKKQMRFLHANNYRPITFKNVLTNNIPSKPIIITFDDGYQSVFQYALPILREFNFQAVVFVISNYIGKDNTWDAKLSSKRFKHLNENEIALLTLAGIEIGSHGESHRALPFLNDDFIRKELEKSRNILHEITNQNIISLAYPFGMQNKRIQNIAKLSGYKFGCINLWGDRQKENPFCLKRIPIYRMDYLSSLQNKLSNGWKNRIELIKLKILSSPAILTPLYQKYLKKINYS